MSVIDEDVVIGRVGQRHEYRRNNEQHVRHGIEPLIAEILRVDLAMNPISRQGIQIEGRCRRSSGASYSTMDCSGSKPGSVMCTRFSSAASDGAVEQ